MATRVQYIRQARKWFQADGVFEIASDAKVDYEYETVVGKNGNNKVVEIGAFVHCRVWLLEDDAEPE